MARTVGSKGRQMSTGKKVAVTRVKFPGARIQHMTAALVILGTCVERRVPTVEYGLIRGNLRAGRI